MLLTTLSDKTSAAELDNITSLQQVLVQRTGEEMTRDEAQEIGDALIDFYQLLAEEVQDDDAA